MQNYHIPIISSKQIPSHSVSFNLFLRKRDRMKQKHGLSELQKSLPLQKTRLIDMKTKHILAVFILFLSALPSQLSAVYKNKQDRVVFVK